MEGLRRRAWGSIGPSGSVALGAGARLRPGRGRGAARLAALCALALAGLLLAEALLVGGFEPFAQRRSTQPPRAHSEALSRAALAWLPAAAQQAIGASTPAYHVSGRSGLYRASSAQQGLSATFSAAGAMIGSAKARLGLRLSGIGYGSQLTAVAASSPRARGEEVLYAHAGVGEWYRNGPLGVEQGFDVERVPSGAATGPLTLSVALSGDLKPTLGASGRSLALERGGRTELRYSGLGATDATGRALHSWLTLQSGRVLIHVDAAGASYPIRIDPFIQQGPKLSFPGEISNPDEGIGAGWSVALSANGNTALVGDPYNDSDEGAVWIFTRSGATWTEQERLERPGCECEFGASLSLTPNGEAALIGGYEGAWVYKHPGTAFEFKEQIPTPAANDDFGRSVALSDSGETALIGAPRETRGGNTGAAYAYTRTSPSAPFALKEKLTGAGETGEGRFGESVALAGDGETALVGAPLNEYERANPKVTGAAWAFYFNGTTWEQQEKFLPSGTASTREKWLFGEGLALSEDGNTAFVSGPGGKRPHKAFLNIYTRTSGIWSLLQTLTGQNFFGWTIATTPLANFVLLGEDYAGNGEGDAIVLERTGGFGTTYSISETVNPGEVPIGEEAQFGESVAISETADTLLVGAPGAADYAGSTWVFQNGTPPSAPTVETGAESEGSETGATLNATVKPNGAPLVTCEFEYGTSSVSEATEPCPTLPLGGSPGPVPVSAPLAGLTPGTVYKYRIVAENSEGKTYGATHEFTTFATSASASSPPSSPAEAVDNSELKATASGGEGTVTIGDYGATQPVGVPYLESGTNYIDVYLGSPNTFTSLTFKVCEHELGGGTEVLWDNGGNWEHFAGEVYTRSPECVTVTITSYTTPDLAQMTGTVFGVRKTVGAPPAVTKLSAKKGPAAGGTAVTITGSGFTSGSYVTFGSRPAGKVTFGSSTSLTAESPASSTGAVEVSVFTAGGRSAPTSKAKFTFESPTVTAVIPRKGPLEGGTRATITGSGFALGEATSIKFGKAAATEVDCSSTTSCRVTVPEAKKEGKVEVRAKVAGKTSTKNAPGDQFDYTS